MNPKYNLKQITSTLEKLFDAGFNTEKKILMMKMEDLSRINNLQSNEPLIIIELKEEIKNKEIIAFFSGTKTKNDKQRKGDEIC